jgi:hypothetical protein
MFLSELQSMDDSVVAVESCPRMRIFSFSAGSKD